MVSRIKSPVVRRTSLPLTAKNESELGEVRESSSYQKALEQLTGIKIEEGDISTSALLHAIFEAGIAAVRQRAELEGYAEIAVGFSKSQTQQQRREARRRRTNWADEE
jgi:hypothetical protein